MEMEIEFYINTDMHVYVYVCVCVTTLATWKWGRVFDRVFFLGTLKKFVRQFSFLFSGNMRILFKTTAMERFFYSII